MVFVRKQLHLTPIILAFAIFGAPFAVTRTSDYQGQLTIGALDTVPHGVASFVLTSGEKVDFSFTATSSVRFQVTYLVNTTPASQVTKFDMNSTTFAGTFEADTEGVYTFGFAGQGIASETTISYDMHLHHQEENLSLSTVVLILLVVAVVAVVVVLLARR